MKNAINPLYALINDKDAYEKIFKPNIKHSSRIYEPNELILEQGKFSPYFYFIKKGKVRVFITKDTTVGSIVTDIGPNSIVGEFRLFDKLTPSANVITVTKTEVIEIDLKSFRSYLDTNREFGYFFLSHVLHLLIDKVIHRDTRILTLLSALIENQNTIKK